MKASLCCTVYVKAVLLNRPQLRVAAAKHLASFPPKEWSGDVLSQVDPHGLLPELVRQFRTWLMAGSYECCPKIRKGQNELYSAPEYISPWGSADYIQLASADEVS